MPRPLKYPFMTMKVGEELTTTGDSRLMLAAMYNTAHRKGWTFVHNIVAARPDGQITIVVTRVGTPEGYMPRIPANIKDRRRLRKGLDSCLLPDAEMPARFRGEYPFHTLRVGDTFTATPQTMNMVAIIRMCQAAQSTSTRTDKKFSINRKCDGLGMLQEVRITRMK